MLGWALDVVSQPGGHRVYAIIFHALRFRRAQQYTDLTQRHGYKFSHRCRKIVNHDAQPPRIEKLGAHSCF